MHQRPNSWGWGWGGGERWHRMLPKGMMTFMFHLFSETIKCLISSLKHTAKIAKKSGLCQTVTGFCSVCVGIGPIVIQIKVIFSHPPTILKSHRTQEFCYSQRSSLSFKRYLINNLTLRSPLIPSNSCYLYTVHAHRICPPSCQPAHNYKLCDTQIYLPQKNKGLSQPCLDSKSTRHCNTGCITMVQSCRLLQDGEGVS